MHASTFSSLAKNARNPEERQLFAQLAGTWNRLADQAESDLSPESSEIKFVYPDEDLPRALKLRLGEYA